MQTDLLVTNVVLVEGLVKHDDGETLLGDDISQAVSGVARAVRELADEHQEHHVSGRPEIPISEEHLALLLEYRFTTRVIANMFRVSPRTIRRRVAKYELDEETSFNDISDCQLDNIMQQFVDAHPVYRLRESLERVESRGVQSRLRQALHRRRYSVGIPNSL